MRVAWGLAVTIASARLFAAPLAAVTAKGDDSVERAIRAARPVLIELGGRKAAGCLVVLGLPGRRTSSESFARFLARGLEGKLEVRATIAVLQDPATGGPVRQGVAIGARVNRWRLDGVTLAALARFTVRAGRGCRRLAVVGYSSGGWAAPTVAIRLAGMLERPTLVGAVAIASATRVAARPVSGLGLRLLFLTAAAYRPEDRGRTVASDGGTRADVLRTAQRLANGGVSVEVRELASARRHPQWHWGVISPCRYFVPPSRPSSERAFGSYPDYGQPSHELFAYLAPFLEERAPPVRFSGPEQRCSSR